MIQRRVKSQNMSDSCWSCDDIGQSGIVNSVYDNINVLLTKRKQ